MKTIYLLTNSSGLIPQKTYERESLDLNIISNILKGIGLNVLILTYHDFINSDFDIKNNYFFYASSQYTHYKEYIQDILLYIQKCGGILIPSFDNFIAHENKNFQELEMKRLDILSPKSHLVGTYEEGVQYLENINFPIIGKKSKGFGSKTVQKINTIDEGKKFLKKNLTDGFIFNIEYFKWLYKKWKFNTLYPKYHGKVIFQDMINGLNHDWKVLIFYHKCFVLKRFTRSNDFRASGSGKFDYEAVPDNTILNFALDTIQKLDVPFASLDIIIKDNIPMLIEYQTVHFGLLTALNGKVYYEFDGQKWDQKKKDREVDYFFAEALVTFIKDK